MFQGGVHKAPEQRMWPVGAGFELRVSLSGYVKGVSAQLAHFHDASVGRGAGETKSVFREGGPEIIVDLIAVAVPLVDKF